MRHLQIARASPIRIVWNNRAPYHSRLFRLDNSRSIFTEVEEIRLDVCVRVR